MCGHVLQAANPNPHEEVVVRGVTKAGNGECGSHGGSTCVCDDVNKAVCGVDGVTYPNQCQISCHGVAKAHEGACKAGDKGCNCPNYHSPVCGQDFITYSNPCSLQCHGVKKAYDGPCLAVKPGGGSSPCFLCPASFRPVCGVDGHTYDNVCLLDCRYVKRAHDGKCRMNNHSGHPALPGIVRMLMMK